MKRLTQRENELAEELLFHTAELIRYSLVSRAPDDQRLQDMKDDVSAINARIITERQEKPIIDSFDFELILASLQRFYRQAEKMTQETQEKHPGWRDPMLARMVRTDALIDKLILWHNSALKSGIADHYAYIDLSWDLSNFDTQTKEYLRLATTPDFDRDFVGQADPHTFDSAEFPKEDQQKKKK